MLKLSPNLQRFLKNEENEFTYKRISVKELEINNKIHELVPSQCGNCNGIGKHLYGSLKGHAFTGSDMEEDPDFFEDMREGKYDVTCKDCDGEGFFMILADNEVNKIMIEEMEEEAIAEAEYQREVMAERRMLGEY